MFYFDFDIAEFRQADRDVLTFHGRDLGSKFNRRIRLEGHADERGTREYSIALGETRAQSIMNFLIVNGPSRSQIENVSYSEERPANSGGNDAAHQQNRQVELVTALFVPNTKKAINKRPRADYQRGAFFDLY